MACSDIDTSVEDSAVGREALAGPSARGSTWYSLFVTSCLEAWTSIGRHAVGSQCSSASAHRAYLPGDS
jgi:hypothetical protein